MVPLSRDDTAADPSQAQKSMPSDGVVVVVVVVVVSGSSLLYTELASHSVSSSSSRQKESRYAWREMSGGPSQLIVVCETEWDQLLSGMSFSSSVFLNRAESRRRIDFLPGVHVSCQMVRSSSEHSMVPFAPALHEIQ